MNQRNSQHGCKLQLISVPESSINMWRSTQAMALAMSFCRKHMGNLHVPNVFNSSKLIIHGILGHFQSSFELSFFFPFFFQPCNSIRIEHWHHLENKLLPQQRCPRIITDEKAQETQKGKLTCSILSFQLMANQLSHEKKTPGTTFHENIYFVSRDPYNGLL